MNDNNICEKSIGQNYEFFQECLDEFNITKEDLEECDRQVDV